MTQRRVTVQTEEEENVFICDECGKADDKENLLTYVDLDSVRQINTIRSITGQRSRIEMASTPSEYPPIHIHPDCLQQWVVNLDIPDGHLTITDLVYRTDNASPKTSWIFPMAFHAGEISLGVVALGMLFLIGFLSPSPNVTIPPMALAAGILLAVMASGYRRGKRSIEDWGYGGPR